MKHFRWFSMAAVVATLLAGSQAACAAPARTGASKWLHRTIQTTDAMGDPIFEPLIRRTTPRLRIDLGFRKRPLSESLFDAMMGPPDDTRTVDDRFVVLSGCTIHDCPNKGLLWIDTRADQTIGAIVHRILNGAPDGDAYGGASLLVFSKERACNDLPDAFRTTVLAWLKAKDVTIVHRRFVGRDGTLDAACLDAELR